jgi:hypothetical protein
VQEVLEEFVLYAVIGHSSHGCVFETGENSPGGQGLHSPSFVSPCPGRQKTAGASSMTDVKWSLAAIRIPKVLNTPPKLPVTNSPALNKSFTRPALNTKFDVVQTIARDALSKRHTTLGISAAAHTAHSTEAEGLILLTK